MYENLKAEMARKNLTKRDIADGLGKDGRTIRNRFNGTAPFTIPEAFAIRDRFFPGVSLDYLFQDNSAPMKSNMMVSAIPASAAPSG